MNTKNKIIAILMAGIVAMAVGMPMAMGDTATTSASVNNKAPVVNSVTVTPAGSVNLNPCPDTTPIKVEASVTDANGADDIAPVKITALTSGGSDASGNITEPLPVPMTYNSTTGNYEATLNLKCTIPTGSYTVEVTATDTGPLTGTNTGTFGVGVTCALDLDFSAVGFGVIDPGSSSTVTGDNNFGTGGPTIKNIGNANMDVKKKITQTSGPEALFPGNTDGTVKTVTKTLTTTLQSFGVTITPEEATAATYELSVPAGTMHGAYNGQLTIEANCA